MKKPKKKGRKEKLLAPKAAINVEIPPDFWPTLLWIIYLISQSQG